MVCDGCGETLKSALALSTQALSVLANRMPRAHENQICGNRRELFKICHSRVEPFNHLEERRSHFDSSSVVSLIAVAIIYPYTGSARQRVVS